MHAPKKRQKLIAAAAAPFAVTLALGAMPAFAGQDAGVGVKADASAKAKVGTEPTVDTRTKDEAARAGAAADLDVEAGAEAKAQGHGSADGHAQGQGDLRAGADAQAKTDTKAQGRAQGGAEIGAEGEAQAKAEGRVATPSGKVRASSKSSATITATQNCMLESSKDISYIAYFVDGELVFKDESVNSETFDLSTVDRDYDEVHVKAGTSVTAFAYPCAEAASGDGSTTVGGDDGGGDDSGEDHDGRGQDEDDKGPGPGDGVVDGRGNSSATITVTDNCVLESSKGISYIAYFVDGELVFKDESVNSETFDLSTVDHDYDEVHVKAGTTVETFAYPCALVADDEIGGEGSNGEGSNGEGSNGEGSNGEGSNGEGSNGDGGDDDVLDDDVVAGDDTPAPAGQDDNGAGNGADNGEHDVAGAETTTGSSTSSDGQVLGTQGSTGTQGSAGTTAPGAYRSAPTQGAGYLPNTGAEDNVSLIAGGTAMAALGGLILLTRRPRRAVVGAHRADR